PLTLLGIRGADANRECEKTRYESGLRDCKTHHLLQGYHRRKRRGSHEGCPSSLQKRSWSTVASCGLPQRQDGVLQPASARELSSFAGSRLSARFARLPQPS